MIQEADCGVGVEGKVRLFSSLPHSCRFVFPVKMVVTFTEMRRDVHAHDSSLPL